MDTWERKSPLIYDEPDLGPELSARSSIQNSELIDAEAPPLVSQSLDSENKNSQPQEKNVDRLKQGISSRTADAAAPATSSKTVSSFRSRTVVIFGMLSFASGVGLGAILVSKSDWNLHARPSYESIAAANPTPAQTTPAVASAPDSNLSETVNQLKSIGTELTSLRQDVRELTSLRQEIRSLAAELAQVREAQQNLMAAQAQAVHKSERPDSRTSDHRNSRGRR
jgi:hypothetical protein